MKFSVLSFNRCERNMFVVRGYKLILMSGGSIFVEFDILLNCTCGRRVQDIYQVPLKPNIHFICKGCGEKTVIRTHIN
jgi:hypothetical protein